MNPIRINDTTYEVKLPAGDRVEVGEIKAVDFKPHLKLNRWDGECFLKIGLASMYQGSPVIEGEKVRWVEPELEACFYPLEPVALGRVIQNERGGFEFEILLKKKPVFNTIELDMEAQGLKFYYQPPLTPEEIAEGAFRPENVVGSYAVYHASRGNVHASAQEADKYRCGKAFHIYRPRVTDANGDWVWAELNIDEANGKLIITVDQDWLDEAVYPVTVDPTFGYETAGGSVIELTANMILGWTFSCPSAGTGTSMSIHGCDSGSNVQMALYLHSDFSLVGSTGAVALGETLAWKTAEFSGSPSLSATDYELTRNTPVVAGFSYDTVSSYSFYYKTQSYGSWPDPLSPSAFQTTRRHSIYCTYTEGGGATEKQSSDLGTGADWLSARDIALPEAGAGVDAFVSLQTPAAKVSSDTGSGADALVSLQVPQAKTSSDNGYGEEAMPVCGALISGSEGGYGIEVFIARLLVAAEAGYGSEASIIGGGGLLKDLFASELGEGADGLTAKIEIPNKGGGMKLWT